jgi:hypothetical protein
LLTTPIASLSAAQKAQLTAQGVNLQPYPGFPTSHTVLQTNGQFAANESSIRSLRGIRIPQENANFSRDFRIKERYSLNIRVEFTNIFNRLRLPTSTTALGGINLGNFATAPTKFTSGANAGLYSGGFGTIVSPLTGSVTGQRAGTLVARFTF